MIIWISETRVIIPVTDELTVHDSDDFLYLLRLNLQAATSSEAAFIRNSRHPSKYGLKVFYHRAIAVFTYTKQKKLAKQGLSPLVGHHGLIHVSLVSPKKVYHCWGFLTEIVEHRGVYATEHPNFFKKLSRINANRDAAGNNVGFDRRNRPVLCDTGTHSFHKESL